jgi:hypothetical protein
MESLQMDEEQRFAFDTWGFLTVEEAIRVIPIRKEWRLLLQMRIHL